MGRKSTMMLVAALALVALVVGGAGLAFAVEQGPTITSPVEGGSLSGKATISGVTGANPQVTSGFSYYKVEFAPAGTENWSRVDDTNYTNQVSDNKQLATWDTSKVADGQYKLRARVVYRTGNYVDSPVVNVRVANTAAALVAGTPRRGCNACHTINDKATGKYGLGYEAMVGAQNKGITHPTVSPSGKRIGQFDETDVVVCMECHAAGTGNRAGKGNVSEYSLRDIVHPVHSFSATFTDRYNGTCFTCHNVSSAGTWDVIVGKLDSDPKGVPNKTPITDTIRARLAK